MQAADGGGGGPAAGAPPAHTQPRLAGAGAASPSVGSVRGLECLEVAGGLGGDLSTLLASVPAGEAEETVAAMAGLFPSVALQTSGNATTWRAGTVVVLLHPQVTTAFRAIGSTAEAALAAQSPSTTEHDGARHAPGRS